MAQTGPLLSTLRLLGTGTSVKRAAIEAGYSSPSAFIAAFRTGYHTTRDRSFEAGRTSA